METSKRDGVERAREPLKEVADQTGALAVVVRRRRFDGVVIGAVSACALILVAAAVSRVSHASSRAQGAQARSDAPPAPIAGETSPAASSADPGAAPLAVGPTDPPPELPTRGTLRLERPAVAGRVWVDGKRLTSSTAVVACGTHQIKVGASGRAHSLDVPCGGELVLTR